MLLSSTPPFLPQAKALSVVVVDDVQEIQNLLHHWLRELGWEVTCASSGREAAKLIQQQQAIDLLITDIIMPDGDGLEVITELRRRHPQARVLAISGGGLHLRATDCLKLAKSLGAHAVLLKPFKREQLLEALSSILNEKAVR